MRFMIAIVCCFLSTYYALPVPQDFNDEQLVFDEESLSQQGNLSPQGFSQVQNQGVSGQQSSLRTAPIISTHGADVLRYIYDFNDLGYKFTYELSDGTIRSEEGAFKDGLDEQGKETKVLVVQGAYSFVGSDGETYWTNYQSDEKGYRPVSGKGVGGIKPGEDSGIDPNLLKSLLG